MRPYMKAGLCTCLMLLCLTALPAQDGAEMLEKFNEYLNINFIAPLRSAGVEITPELRAKCTAYQLRRHLNDGGAFEHDRKLVAELRQAVKEFITGAGGEQAWSIVEGGLNGEYTDEVEQLLGGTGYVPPVFDSYDDVVSDRKKRNYSDGLLEKYGWKEKVMEPAEAMLQAFSEKRYQNMLDYAGGHLYEELSEIFKEMATNPEENSRMDQMAENAQWKFTWAGMSESSPMMVHLLLDFYEVDEWEKYEMYLLLDEGSWRVVSFDGE